MKLLGILMVLLGYSFGAMIVPLMTINPLRHKAGVTIGLVLVLIGILELTKKEPESIKSAAPSPEI